MSDVYLGESCVETRIRSGDRRQNSQDEPAGALARPRNSRTGD